MNKKIKFLFIIIAFLSIADVSGQIPEEPKTRSYTSWDKAVITDSKIMTILPFKFPIKAGMIDTPGCMTSKTIVADVIQKGSMAEFKYTDSLYCMSADFVSFINLIPCKDNDLIFPKTWDYLDNVKFDLRVITDYINKPKYQVSGISNCVCIGSLDLRTVRKPKLDENGNFVVDENGKPVLEENVPDYKSIVYYQIVAIDENTLQMFLLKNNQFLVWEFNSNRTNEKKWKFLYSFKVYDTEPYRVCQLDKTLYIVMKDAGIYKLDVESAIENKPEAPKDVIVNLQNIDKYKVLKWEGFDQDHIKENAVFADKISDLSYTTFIVDKDENTAYFQAGEYFFEITDLDHCVKMPPVWAGLQTFEDKEADRLRTVLEAIELLHKSPIESPDYRTVMGLPEETILKPDINKNPLNGNLNNGSNGDMNKPNMNSSNNGDNRNGYNSNPLNRPSNYGSNTDNSFESNRDKNKDGKNGNSANGDESEIIDDNSIFTYISVSAGIILFLTLIFFLLSRKHKS